jgi:hypothetical protein
MKSPFGLSVCVSFAVTANWHLITQVHDCQASYRWIKFCCPTRADLVKTADLLNQHGFSKMGTGLKFVTEAARLDAPDAARFPLRPAGARQSRTRNSRAGAAALTRARARAHPR